MPSTREERLLVVYESYRSAYERRVMDWKEATTVKQVNAIANNIDKLETLYLSAAQSALDANGANVEGALKDAKSAQKNVEKAYKSAKGLANKVRAVGKLIDGVGKLVKAAS